MPIRVNQETLANIAAAVARGEATVGGRTPPDLAVAPGIAERDFTWEVIALAQSHGWLAVHIPPTCNQDGDWRTAVTGDGVGLVDLILVRERVVWAELKVGDNTLSARQREWAARLRAAGQEVYCWYPADAAEIGRVLT